MKGIFFRKRKFRNEASWACMYQGNKTFTSVVTELLSIILKYIQNIFKKILRFIVQHSVFVSQTPERSTASNAIFWIMILTVQEKSKIWFRYHETQSIILTRPCLRRILQKCPAIRSVIIRCEQLSLET